MTVNNFYAAASVFSAANSAKAAKALAQKKTTERVFYAFRGLEWTRIKSVRNAEGKKVLYEEFCSLNEPEVPGYRGEDGYYTPAQYNDEARASFYQEAYADFDASFTSHFGAMSLKQLIKAIIATAKATPAPGEARYYSEVADFEKLNFLASFASKTPAQVEQLLVMYNEADLARRQTERKASAAQAEAQIKAEAKAAKQSLKGKTNAEILSVSPRRPVEVSLSQLSFDDQRRAESLMAGNVEDIPF
jgi:hypothetical protein